MKKLILLTVLFVAACAAGDYALQLNQCIANHVGDPVGREQCLCDTAKDAGRTCDFLDGGVQ